MPKASTISTAELETLDRFYREGGLRAMASPHVHYDEPTCPHPGCSHQMEWIDFKLELHGDPEGVYKPLVRAWWEGSGFVGRCPACQEWIRFTTLKMEAVDDDLAAEYLAASRATGTPGSVCVNAAESGEHRARGDCRGGPESVASAVMALRPMGRVSRSGPGASRAG